MPNETELAGPPLQHLAPHPGREPLELQFLDTLGLLWSDALAALAPIVRRLLDLGATRSELIHLAVDAGYNEGYVRSLISKILVCSGQRRRKPGAGPKTPPPSLALLAYTRHLHGDLAEKYLLAAYRAGRTERAARSRLPASPTGVLQNLPLNSYCVTR